MFSGTSKANAIAVAKIITEGLFRKKSNRKIFKCFPIEKEIGQRKTIKEDTDICCHEKLNTQMIDCIYEEGEFSGSYKENIRFFELNIDKRIIEKKILGIVDLYLNGQQAIEELTYGDMKSSYSLANYISSKREKTRDFD